MKLAEFILALNKNPLRALAIRIREINLANGWNCLTPKVWEEDDYRIPASLALVHEEVSEAVTAFRKRDFENFREEIADVIIRCLDISIGLGIDIDAEVLAKMQKNSTRGYKHGGKRI